MTVAIVDYGMGNIGSVRRALLQLQVKVEIAFHPEQLSNAERIILPGVGNFSDGMAKLSGADWVEALREQALVREKPLLGICLGMQLLASRGYEGNERGTSGLSLIPGDVEHLSSLGCTLRIPHVGWNSIHLTGSPSLFQGIPGNTDFYFVHGFSFRPTNTAHVLAHTDYDIPVVAAVQSGCIFGTQFHPEKSSKAGLLLLRNFLSFAPC